MTEQTLRRPGITREHFLATKPAHQRVFFGNLLEDLPSGYVLTSVGIAQKVSNSPQPVLPFCSPFRVAALVRQRSSGNWSRLIELIDPDGAIVECIVPSGKLDGKPREAISLLSDAGLMVFEDMHLATILHLIRNWPATARLNLVEKVGWTADRDAFMLPSGRMIARGQAAGHYRLDGRPTGREIGNLTAWQNGVASLALGNCNLVFAISLGLSTPLLEMTELDSLIYHLYGRTSRGKTRALRCALSVWPKVGDKDKTWHATINGLEGEIARSNGILMGLDELPKAASPELGDIIYRLANGGGKGRAEQEGSPRARANWRTAVISTGEYSVVETLKRIGLTPTGGQGVRMLDIPAIGAHGIFDDMRGYADSDAFVRALDGAIARAAGPAGVAFVERLMALEAPKDEIEVAVRDQAAPLLERLGLIPGDPETSEIRRVVENFALIAVAGEWASAWGITGWPQGIASEAVGSIAQRWLAERGRMPLDQRQAVEKVRDHLATLEQAFVPLNAAKTIPEGQVWPPGFSDDTSFYVLNATLADIATKAAKQDGRDNVASLLEALEAADFLQPGGEKTGKQVRLPAIGKQRPRAYRIRRTILDFKADLPAPRATEEQR